jgi:general secretion pathway protein G
MVKSKSAGFTLIELLVVLTIVALLLSIITPRYLSQTDKAREAVLKQNLESLRVCIDKFRADKGYYPPTLNELITAHYLRHLPEDPMTQKSTSWILVLVEEDGKTGIYDVKSSAQGQSKEGLPYASL